MSRSTLICFFLLFISISISSATSLKKPRKPCKSLVVYFHDIVYNGQNEANATATIIGAPDKANLTTLTPRYFRFGNLVAFDDRVTLDNNFHSPSIGRAQGMYLYDSKSTFAAFIGFSLVLNTTSYHGTIDLLGADLLMQNKRDVSVVGGTGDFFMHRGIATLMTDASENPTYFRLRVEVNFYECW